MLWAGFDDMICRKCSRFHRNTTYKQLTNALYKSILTLPKTTLGPNKLQSLYKSAITWKV